MSELIQVRDEGGVRTLVLDRGDGNNAVGPDMMGQLGPALDAAAADDSVRVVVLTGQGKMFSAGGDLAGLLDGLAHRDPQREREGLVLGLSVVERIVALPKPTISMINGSAAGGGLALALACDLRIASSTARLAYAYAMIGLAGDFGLNWLVGRILGPARARAVAFGGPLDAVRALQLGLIDAVEEPGVLAQAVQAQARTLAALSPAALAAIKRNLDAAPLPFAEAGRIETESFLALRDGAGHRAALEEMLERLKGGKARSPG